MFKLSHLTVFLDNGVYPLGKKLIQIFALALGLPETALDQYFRTPLTDITIQHYPAHSHSTASEPMELLSAHADFGAVTLLMQHEVAGLEVLNANGVWVPAPPIPGAFVVNTGNYVEAWTNGKWAATVHRVYGRMDRPRYSLPFFMHRASSRSTSSTATTPCSPATTRSA